jgi:hypothetical protein
MRHRPIALVSSLLLALALVACSTAGDERSCPSCDDSPIPVEAICGTVVLDVCTSLVECVGYEYVSVEECVGDRECGGENDLLEAVERGWVEYDAEAAGRCHARFQSDPCNFGFFLFVPNLIRVLEACGDVLTPAQEAGDPCTEDVHCVAGTFCATDESCLGTCVPFGGLDAACEWNWECEEGLECLADVCAPLPAVDEPCAAGLQCGEGAYCDRDSNLCAPHLGEGAACERIDFSCSSGLFCAAPAFETGTCEPLSGEGGPCTWNPDCLDDLMCHQPDPFELGECRERFERGEECEATYQCVSGLRCFEGSCEPYAGLGEDCSTSFGASPCAEGLVCNGTQCVRPLPVGADCAVTDGMCTGSRCVEGTCVARASLGEACTVHDECKSRRCELEVCVDRPACL